MSKLPSTQLLNLLESIDAVITSKQAVEILNSLGRVRRLEQASYDSLVFVGYEASVEHLKDEMEDALGGTDFIYGEDSPFKTGKHEG